MIDSPSINDVFEIEERLTALRTDFRGEVLLPEDDDANVEWARDGFAAIEQLSVSGGRYGNFPGFAEDPPHLLFGENYDRLVAVKTKYDPENLFHVNQNIEPQSTSD